MYSETITQNRCLITTFIYNLEMYDLLISTVLGDLLQG